MIRVMIVDDHDMVRSSIALALESYDDLQVVGEASNGMEAVSLCTELQPDVVLMDLKMPEMDGVAATDSIHQRYPNVQIIALTSADYHGLVSKALQAGAASYLFKNASISELYEEIRRVYSPVE